MTKLYRKIIIYTSCFHVNKPFTSILQGLDYNLGMKTLLLLLATTLLFAQEVRLQVLGSGGPELDGRASTSYLLWIEHKAKILIDAGSGSMLRFEESGAKLEDLELIFLTHMHIDHVVDLPSYIKAGYFSARQRPLPIIGPKGNHFFPSTNTFINLQFGEKGAYRYMSDVLTQQSDSFQILAESLKSEKIINRHFKDFDISMISVNHGNIPALALRIDVGDKSVLISGDSSNANHQLEKLAQDVDLFIAHHAIAEIKGTYANQLHMTPSSIATIAQKSHVKKVVLSHRMQRTLSHEKESLKVMQQYYKGPILFADDLSSYKLQD